jgi:phosphohistidine phosphatase SixA
MQKLIVVRHGDYGYNDRLSDFGKRQMQNIATQLKPHVDGKKVVVLSSVAERATDSADIITEQLGVPGYESHDVLWSENRHPENLPKAVELVQQHADTDVLILVTHLEYAERFPNHFLHTVLSTKDTFAARKVEKGQAIIIDCDNKTTQLIRS